MNAMTEAMKAAAELKGFAAGVAASKPTKAQRQGKVKGQGGKAPESFPAGERMMIGTQAVVDGKLSPMTKAPIATEVPNFNDVQSFRTAALEVWTIADAAAGTVGQSMFEQLTSLFKRATVATIKEALAPGKSEFKRGESGYVRLSQAGGVFRTYLDHSTDVLALQGKAQGWNAYLDDCKAIRDKAQAEREQAERVELAALVAKVGKVTAEEALESLTAEAKAAEAKAKADKETPQAKAKAHIKAVLKDHTVGETVDSEWLLQYRAALIAEIDGALKAK